MLRSLACALALICGLTGPGAAGELCLVPSQANGWMICIECNSLDLYGLDYVGFRTGGGDPCTEGNRPPGWEPCMWSNPFGWTISASSTDPHKNTAVGYDGVSAPDGESFPNGITELYLWYYCGEGIAMTYGLAAAEFDLGGTIPVLGFTPLNGFLNAGGATQLQLSVGGCPLGPVVAGIIHLEGPVTVQATTWGSVKALYR